MAIDDGPLRLTFEQYGRTYQITLPFSDISAGDFIDELVKPVMLAAGFHPDAVRELLDEEEEAVDVDGGARIRGTKRGLFASLRTALRWLLLHWIVPVA